MAKAEILAIGTELLLGQILNTNAQFLSQELADLGIDCMWHSTVGDNKDRIKESLKFALDRVDIVITTGGLGPTADDLTIECIAEFFGCPMIFDEATSRLIKSIFEKRGLSMPPSNDKQAKRPEGSEILPNPVGTAPGIIWKLGENLLSKAGIKDPQKERVILTFPGVPSEMETMWGQTGRSYLESNYSGGVIWSCDLKHYGIGESALAEQVGDLLDMSNPTVAPLAGSGECRLRVTAKAKTGEEARKMAQPVIDEITSRSGDLLYGTDKDSLEAVVGRMLTDRDLTIALAESCTGGLASKRLTDIAGSSKYVKLNLVTYSNEAKQEILGVHEFILNTKGAVSSECAHAMATGARKVAHADIGVGITGVAGPDGGTDEKPVGLVYLALVTNDFQTDKTLRFPSNLPRREIRERTASEALNMVRLFLLNQRTKTAPGSESWNFG
ncbi:MAG: competence/damage-inducible protein A [Candidatus Obscuribacterales bacterium]|nr:competence/damage-inducible protein A [Candidatus Obscuribacterales bacterium]